MSEPRFCAIRRFCQSLQLECASLVLCMVEGSRTTRRSLADGSARCSPRCTAACRCLQGVEERCWRQGAPADSCEGGEGYDLRWPRWRRACARVRADARGRAAAGRRRVLPRRCGARRHPEIFCSWTSQALSSLTAGVARRRVFQRELGHTRRHMQSAGRPHALHPGFRRLPASARPASCSGTCSDACLPHFRDVRHVVKQVCRACTHLCMSCFAFCCGAARVPSRYKWRSACFR